MSTETGPPAAAGAGRGLAARLKQVLNGPLSGIAPWIVMSVLAGMVHYEIAVGLALLTALFFVLAGRLGGSRVKLMEVIDLAFFVGLMIVAQLASARVTGVLEYWAGEIANVALVLIAVGSMVVRRPFTLEYAREETPPEMWQHPAFLRTNYVITGFWALAFTIAAVSGFVGDAVIGDNQNIWTGWIIQIGAMLVAIQFTAWYPRVVEARGLAAAGLPTPPPPPLSALLIGLAGYLPVVGVIALLFDAAPAWVGIALIVVGVLASHATARDLGRFFKRHGGKPEGGGRPPAR